MIYLEYSATNTILLASIFSSSFLLILMLNVVLDDGRSISSNQQPSHHHQSPPLTIIHSLFCDECQAFSRLMDQSRYADYQKSIPNEMISFTSVSRPQCMDAGQHHPTEEKKGEKKKHETRSSKIWKCLKMITQNILQSLSTQKRSLQ